MLPVVYGENMFDDLFDNGFFGSHNPLFGKNARNLMKTDIRETDDAKAYRLAVDLPGFKKDEISLDLRDGYLTISAEKGLDKDEESKNVIDCICWFNRYYRNRADLVTFDRSE